QVSQRSSLSTATGCTEAVVGEGTQATESNPADPTFVCQATQLPYATTALAWWDVRQYVEDYRSGNVTIWRLFSGFIYSLYYNVSHAGIGVGPLMEWFYNRFHPVWHGTPFPAA